MDAYWRAANYLSVGQLYLYDNPLLKKPLELSHVKPLVVGHWGTTQGWGQSRVSGSGGCVAVGLV
jgi:xylulose-5-phosphate/fructose-6-phosphate phosphoketolase